MIDLRKAAAVNHGSLAALLLLLLFGGAGASSASTRPLVVVLAPAARQALASRMCAEIALRKIRCRTMVSASRATSPGVLERTGASAAVSISGAEVLLRRGDRRQTFALQRLAEPDEMVALRTAEVARAFLSDAEIPAEVLQQAPAAASRERSRFALQLEAGTTWATPQLRGPLQLGLRFAWEISERFAVEARALFPISAQTIEGDEGVGSVFVGLASAEVRLTLFRHRWIVSSLGLGLGVLAVQVSGDDTDGYDGVTDWGASALGQASLRLGVPLAGGFSAVVDAAAGISFSRLVVAFDDREAAAGGRPLITVAGGVRYTW